MNNFHFLILLQFLQLHNMFCTKVYLLFIFKLTSHGPTCFLEIFLACICKSSKVVKKLLLLVLSVEVCHHAPIFQNGRILFQFKCTLFFHALFFIFFLLSVDFSLSDVIMNFEFILMIFQLTNVIIQSYYVLCLLSVLFLMLSSFKFVLYTEYFSSFKYLAAITNGFPCSFYFYIF